MEHDPRYTDLIQEIKERLYTIDDVMSGRTALLGQLAHEFCFLQLRLICECISYSCVIAHAYIKELQTPEFQTQWSADSLIKNLDGLYENFYPQPRAMTATDAGVHLSEIDGEQLGKDLDPFDLICHVVYDRPPLTRKERADQVRKRDIFTRYGPQAQVVLNALLDKYADAGIGSVEDGQILRLKPLSDLGTPVELVRSFGGKEQFDQAIRDLETALYTSTG